MSSRGGAATRLRNVHVSPRSTWRTHLERAATFGSRAQVGTVFRPWLDALWEDHGDAAELAGQVVVGDLNAYPDYEWPFDALTLDGEIAEAVGGPCTAVRETAPKTRGSAFVDAWLAARPGEPGSTFPNPETMDLDPARPDRIMVRGGLEVAGAWVLGCDTVENANGHSPSDHRIVVADLRYGD